MKHYRGQEVPDTYRPDPHVPPPDQWPPMPPKMILHIPEPSTGEIVHFASPAGSWGTITDTIIGSTDQPDDDD